MACHLFVSRKGREELGVFSEHEPEVNVEQLPCVVIMMLSRCLSPMPRMWCHDEPAAATNVSRASEVSRTARRVRIVLAG